VELVLMDIRMPEMDGIEACRRLKADPRFHDLPVLMVTAQPEDDELQVAFEAGASDYIRKPVHRAVLLTRVEAALRLQRELERGRARERDLLEAQRLLERANANLHRLANLDALTGIANRRQFDYTFDEEWRRAFREDQPLALLILDIDCFKSYNDTYGHQAGDACLKAIAQVLQAAVKRAGDLAARYGGEEFAVILPWTDGPGALTVAEQLRLAIEELRIPHEASPLGGQVTVSVGAATAFPRARGSRQDLVASADRALYRAKSGGRNCVHLDVEAADNT